MFLAAHEQLQHLGVEEAVDGLPVDVGDEVRGAQAGLERGGLGVHVLGGGAFIFHYFSFLNILIFKNIFTLNFRFI